MQDTAGAEAKPGRVRLWLIAIIAGSIVLSLPAILGGYWLDDYWRFDTSWCKPAGPFDYYDCLHSWITSANVHWWAHPEIEVRRLDPLGSLSLFLDYQLWSSSPIFGHLQSVLWFVLVLLGTLRVFRTLLPARVVPWSLAIFSLGEFHSMTLGWISARHHVMGGAFSVWALLFYLRWRRQGVRHGLPLSLSLLILGLLTSESAIAVVPFVVACELLGSVEPWRRRLLAAAPFLGVAVIYLVAYVALGFGAFHAAPAYLNPFQQPGQYLLGVVPKAIAMLGVFSFGIPGMLRIMPGVVGLVPMIAGAIGAAAILGALYRGRETFLPEQGRELRWLGLAVFFAMLPALSSNVLEGRELIVAGLAFAAVAGQALRALLDTPKRWTRLAHVSALCFGFFFLSPLLRLGESVSYAGLSKTQERIGKESRIGCAPGARVFLINGDFPLQLYAAQLLGRHQGIEVGSWRLLLDPQADLQVLRSNVDTLTISSERAMIAEHLILGSGIEAGAIFDRGDLTARILQSSEQGPTRIEFTIEALEDSSRTCLLYYGDGLLRPAIIPAIGESVTIPLEMSMAPPKK